MAEYDKLTESNQGGEALWNFLVNKVPDFEEIVKEEAEDLKIEMSEEMESVGLK